jgi:hypothetical protein
MVKDDGTGFKMLLKTMLEEYKKMYIENNAKIWINYCIVHKNFPLESAIELFCEKGEIKEYTRHLDRRTPDELKNFKEMLIDKLSEIEGAENFEELLNRISTIKVSGIGDLTLYDMALLLTSCKGFDLGKEPQYIYSHSGSKKGLKNLCNLSGKKKYEKCKLGVPDLVNSDLSPARLEDFLCRYKKIKPITNSTTTG